jgi:hypothetical protein
LNRYCSNRDTTIIDFLLPESNNDIFIVFLSMVLSAAFVVNFV